jgi:CheY-like chemotaxis protein
MNEISDRLLLVEDNRDDVFFLQRALQKANISTPIELAQDGQAAIDCLKAAMEHREPGRNPFPALVFLDLKIPYASGFEVLKWIREQPALAKLPVVILTSSPEQRDREMALALGATGYLVKPPTAEMMRQLLMPLCVPVVPQVTPSDRSIAERQQPRV